VRELPRERLVVFIASTTGEGEVPDPMRAFWRFLLRRDLPAGALASVSVQTQQPPSLESDPFILCQQDHSKLQLYNDLGGRKRGARVNPKTPSVAQIRLSLVQTGPVLKVPCHY